MDGISSVLNRINEIRNGGKNLAETLKPDGLKEFENMYKEALNNSSKSNTTQKVEIHPFLNSNKTKIEMKENELLENNETANKKVIDASITKASKKYGVSEELIRAVIKVESDFDQYGVSKVGAMGLMQLMPKTALELGVEKPFDIEENIEGGTKYLKMMLNKYDGDLDKTLSAYNAGPDRVDEANGIPNIEETQNYVKMIRKILNK